MEKVLFNWRSNPLYASMLWREKIKNDFSIEKERKKRNLSRAKRKKINKHKKRNR